MITGNITSTLEGNARIFTLTVDAMPTPGALIEWTETYPDGHTATVRGWVLDRPSTYDGPTTGTVLLQEAAGSILWAVIVVNVIDNLIELPREDMIKVLTAGNVPPVLARRRLAALVSLGAGASEVFQAINGRVRVTFTGYASDVARSSGQAAYAITTD